MSSVQISAHFYVLKAAVVTRQVCKMSSELLIDYFLKKSLRVKAVLHPNQAGGSGEQMQFMGHLHLILAACLWRRCLMIAWATSRSCQSAQMMSLVPKDSPVLSLSSHSAPHRQRAGGVDVCGFLDPHTAWCLGWGTLQRSKTRSSFWLTRLTLIWQVSVTRIRLFQTVLGQGWAQKAVLKF